MSLHTPRIQAPRLHAIASGKGGVGKTVLAITLAHALARAGLRVLLVDADLGLANLDIQLGLVPSRDLSTVIAGRARLADAVLRHAAGFDLLPGRSGSPALAGIDPAGLDRLLAGLRALATGYDHLLLDCGAGLSATTRRISATADQLLVVATPEPTSLTDAYAVLKLHRADRGPPDGAWPAAIIANAVRDRAEGLRVHATLARACRGFLGDEPTLAGIVRADRHVADAIRHQTPLLTRHPTCNAAADIITISEKLRAAPVLA